VGFFAVQYLLLASRAVAPASCLYGDDLPSPKAMMSANPAKSYRIRTWGFHFSTISAKYPSLQRWASDFCVGVIQSMGSPS
jgi:hypothetical protein